MERLWLKAICLVSLLATPAFAANAVKTRKLECRARCLTSPADGGGAYQTILGCTQRGGREKKCRKQTLKQCTNRGADLTCGAPGYVALFLPNASRLYRIDPDTFEVTPLELVVVHLDLIGRLNRPTGLSTEDFTGIDPTGQVRVPAQSAEAVRDGEVCDPRVHIVAEGGEAECDVVFAAPLDWQSITVEYDKNGYYDRENIPIRTIDD